MTALPQTLEEQFDYAIRIIQRCFQQKASQTEEELFRLRHTLKERELLLQELATKVSTLEQQFEGAQVTIQRLTEENGRMSHTLNYLNNEVVRIHSLKRAILDSLDGDSNSLSSHTLTNSQIPSSFYNSISSPVRFSPSAAVHSATNLYQQQQQQPAQPQTPSHLQYSVSTMNGHPKKIQISPPPKFFPSTQTHPKYVSPSLDTLDIIAQIDRGIELSSFSNSVSTINAHSPLNIKTTPTATSYQPSQLSFASKYKPFDPSELGLGESTSSSSIGKLNLGSNNNTSNSSEVSSLSSIKSTLSSINKDGPSLLRSIGASSLSSLSNNNDSSSSSLTSNTTTNSENSNTSIPPPPLKMPLKPPTLKSIIQPKPDSDTNSNENPTPSEPSSSIPPPPLKMPLKPPTLKSIIQPKPDSDTNSNENPSANSSASESSNAPLAPQPPKPPMMPNPPPAPKLKLKLPPPKPIDG